MENQNFQQLGNVFSEGQTQQSPDGGVVKWRMSTDPDIIDLENRLLGRIYDTTNKKYVDSEESLKLCNVRGVSAARLWISAAVNKSSLQANLDKEEFFNFMDNIIDSITKDVGLNYFEYGITATHKEMFVTIIINMIFLILSRSVGDKEREYSVRQGKETFVQRYLANPMKNALGNVNL